MKILFVTQYFYPETEIGGIRIAEIARHLLAQGHEPVILTGFPNYPSGKLHPDYQRRIWHGSYTELVDGLRVFRVALYPSHSKTTMPRLANYFSFAITASMRSLTISDFDVVVATSPPLTVGIPALLKSTASQIPLVLEVRDLWPESAVQLGYLQNQTVRSTAYGLERLLYARASRIVCVSNGIRDDIVARGIPAAKCAVLTNGIDTDLFRPEARDENVEELKRSGSIVGVYLGSLSAYHGLEHALDLLEQLRPSAHVKVIFSGGGSAESEFRTALDARRLKNAVFLPALSRKHMPGVIASSAFCLAFVKESSFSRWLLSSKIFMYMACGRPIYAAANGETRRVIEEAGAGYVVQPNAYGISQLAKRIGELRGDAIASSYGFNGRTYALRYCSWERIAKEYEQVLTAALDPRARVAASHDLPESATGTLNL